MDPGFFARFGLFVAPDFLDEETCRRVRTAMEEAQQVEATVEDEGEYQVDRSHRKTRLAKVDPETLALVSDRLNALRETLSSHFGFDLEECEKPQFLVYEEGDFFRPHMDSSDKDADEASDRRVSTVVFLNETSEKPAEGAYGGGALAFYGLLQDDPKGEGIGLPLVGSPGALVSFPSHLIHGVSPVTHGRRYTIASWFPSGTN